MVLCELYNSAGIYKNGRGRRIGRLPILESTVAYFGFMRPDLQSKGNRFGAGAGVELREDGGDVMIDRSWGYKKAVGDFGVAESIDHQREYLHLPACESRGVFLRAGSWAAGDAAHARCAQGLPQSFRLPGPRRVSQKSQAPRAAPVRPRPPAPSPLHKDSRFLSTRRRRRASRLTSGARKARQFVPSVSERRRRATSRTQLSLEPRVIVAS